MWIADALTTLGVICVLTWALVLASVSASMWRTLRGSWREHDAMRTLVFFYAALSLAYMLRSFVMPGYLAALSEPDLAVLFGLRMLSLLMAVFTMRVTRAYGTGA